MLGKKIDTARCDKCGECVRICANSRVIDIEPEGFPIFARLHKCIECGHCFAICPRGAILIEGEDRAEAATFFAEPREAGDGGWAPNPFFAQLCSLRSTRFFDGMPVEREKLLLILEAMVRSPSAGNEQNRNFYIFGEKPKVDGLERDTFEHYSKLARSLRSPIARKLAMMALAGKNMSKLALRNRILADMPKKERAKYYLEMLDEVDPESREGFLYFNNASAAFIVTSCTNTSEFHKSYHRSDAATAVTYGALAASSLGIASCRVGLAEMAFAGERSMREKCGIPKNERVDGILALGHSRLKWRAIPPRGPVKAIWV